MGELSDVKQQQKILEEQLSELRRKQLKLEREAGAIVNVDNAVLVTREGLHPSIYGVQISQKFMGRNKQNLLDFYYPCLFSENKDELEAEMLRLSQRLIDAAIQLRQIEG